MRIASIIGLIVLATTSVPASADEVWRCDISRIGASKPALTRFWIRRDDLIEYGKPGLTYRVLANSSIGIVAVAVAAADPRLAGVQGSHPDVWSLSITIDRGTGKAGLGSVDPFGPSLPIAYGKCRLQTNKDKDAVWPPGYVGPKN